MSDKERSIARGEALEERERAASNRRLAILLGVGAALVALGLGLVFLIGKSLAIPPEDFDRDAAIRIADAAVKEVDTTALGAAAASTTTGHQPEHH